MQTRTTRTNQIQNLLTAHPGLLGEEPLPEQESFHVVHCMQCELQFQVEVDGLDGGIGIDEGKGEKLHITHIQQPTDPFPDDKISQLMGY